MDISKNAKGDDESPNVLRQLIEIYCNNVETVLADPHLLAADVKKELAALDLFFQMQPYVPGGIVMGAVKSLAMLRGMGEPSVPTPEKVRAWRKTYLSAFDQYTAMNHANDLTMREKRKHSSFDFDLSPRLLQHDLKIQKSEGETISN